MQSANDFEKKKNLPSKTLSSLQLIELRASVQRVEDQAGWREDNLRREIAVRFFLNFILFIFYYFF